MQSGDVQGQGIAAGHPLRAGQGFGRALVSQLVANLAALRVERLETVVAPEAVELLRFFLRAGFGPSERLAFARRLD